MDNKIIFENINIHTDFINEWVKNIGVSSEYTTHWFIDDLPYDIKNKINIIINANKIKSIFYSKFKFFFRVKPVYCMNELYVSINNSTKNNSDKVFFKPHIDGPFGFFPFCSVYRTLIGCNDNNFIITHFPLKNKEYNITKNDLLAFDYNKEIHYITFKKDNHLKSTKRIVLKLHYVVYPIGFDILAYILSYFCESYNTIARYAFLKTLQPKTKKDKLINSTILFITDNWIYTEKYIGFKNIAYLTSIYLFYCLYNLWNFFNIINYL